MPGALATMVSYEFFVGGQSKVFLAEANEVATTINRTFHTAPLLIPGGQNLRIVQA